MEQDAIRGCNGWELPIGAPLLGAQWGGLDRGLPAAILEHLGHLPFLRLRRRFL